MKFDKHAFLFIIFAGILEVLKFVCCGFVYFLIKDPLMTAAAKERGYDLAYGGEWILIIGAVALTYWGVTKLIESIFFTPPRKRG